MQKEAKVKCLVNGQIRELTKRGFEIAKEYYGAVLADDLQLHEIPIELRQPIIIPSKPLKVEQKLQVPIEITKSIAKEPEVKADPISEPKAEAQTEVKTDVKASVKQTRKRGRR